MAETDDGFRLAEEDLLDRGMGELQGLRQSGELPFRMLHPLRDELLLARTREIARELLGADPGLRRPEHRALSAWLVAQGQRSPVWSSAG